jgi:hypothetical protein
LYAEAAFTQIKKFLNPLQLNPKYSLEAFSTESLVDAQTYYQSPLWEKPQG